MKKTYQNPRLESMIVKTEDIISTSLSIGNTGEDLLVDWNDRISN